MSEHLKRENDRLREALQFYVNRAAQDNEGTLQHYERLADEFERKTGMMAPGKSAPMEIEATRDRNKEHEEWDRFLMEPIEHARKTLSEFPPDRITNSQITEG